MRTCVHDLFDCYCISCVLISVGCGTSLVVFSNDSLLKKSFFSPILHGMNSLSLCGSKFLFRVSFCFWIRSLRSLPLLTIVRFVWLCLIWLLSPFSFPNRKLGKIIERSWQNLFRFFFVKLWNGNRSVFLFEFWRIHHRRDFLGTFKCCAHRICHMAPCSSYLSSENLVLARCCDNFDKIDEWTLSSTQLWFFDSTHWLNIDQQ